MEGWPGLYLREGPEGLDKRTNLWIFKCAQPYCYYAVSCQDEATGISRRDTHKCPQTGAIHFGASVTRTLIEQCWDMADDAYAKLQVCEDPIKLEQLRGELKGISKTIAIFMPPFFRTMQEVAEEIRKRFTMKDAGQSYETRGLGHRQFEFEKVKPPTVASRAQKVLSEQEIKAIRFASESGMFTPENLAETYSVTVAVITEVCS